MQRQAVAYIRASTDDQVNTLVVQQQRLQHYCALHGITLVDSFIDAGVSGSEDFADRPEAGAMLAFMEQTGITEIVFTTCDRLFRNTLDALRTFGEFAERGIRCHALDMVIDTGTAIGRLMLGLRFLLGEFELDQRAERQRHVFDHLRQQQRRIGDIPYGWLAVADPALPLSRRGNVASRLIPDPEEQRILRDIILPRHRDGHSPAAIAKELNDLDIPTKNAGATFNRRVKNPDGTVTLIPQTRSGKWHAIVVAGIVERLDTLIAPEDSEAA